MGKRSVTFGMALAVDVASQLELMRFKDLHWHDDAGHAQYTPEKFAVETRKLQILQSEFNALFKWPMWGMQITFMVTAIFATCGSMWNEEGQRKLELAISAGAGVWLLTMIFTSMASMYENWVDNLKQWRRCRDQQAWFMRVLRLTPPVKVLLESYFYADKELVLTSLGIVVENSVTLLVSRRSS